MAHGPWPKAHGPWPMAQGPRPMAHGPWPMAQGPWPKAHGLRPKAHGPWPKAHGPRPMAQAPWPMAHGRRPMAQGPTLRVQGPEPMAQGLKWGKTHFVPKWRKLRNSETQNRDLASPNDRELNLISNGPIESFWGALWLGIQPFLCFDVGSRRIMIWRAQMIEN